MKAIWGETQTGPLDGKAGALQMIDLGTAREVRTAHLLCCRHKGISVSIRSNVNCVRQSRARGTGAGASWL